MPTIIVKAPLRKTCSKCKIEKDSNTQFPKSGFYKNGEPKTSSYCIDCKTIYNKELNARTQFNITLEERDLLGDSCAICGRKGKTRAIAVDHDHKTGLIRGRLCDRCNRGIAWFHDDPELFRRCSDYLLNPPAIRILGEARYGRKGNRPRKKHHK